MRMDGRDFVALPNNIGTGDESEFILPLTTRRKRHRRAKKIRTGISKEYIIKVQGMVLANGKLLNLGAERIKELIGIAVTSMYGEMESKKRFKWEITGFDNERKMAQLHLTTPDYVSFAAALALLPVEEGRLKVIEKSV